MVQHAHHASEIVRDDRPIEIPLNNSNNPAHG
jgi:hypothetical protein